MRNFNKLFVIALPRCATVSICEALGMVGCFTAHLGRIYGESSDVHYSAPRLIRMYEQISQGDYQLDILRLCRGLVDYPACSFDVFQRLDAAFPGSLFVNVRRDQNVHRWLQSVERQFVGLQLVKEGLQASDEEQHFMRAMRGFRKLTFGQVEFEANVYERAYHAYQQRVTAYFAGRADVLLDIEDISELEDSGFEKICGFLDCDPVTLTFPRSNEHSTQPYVAFMDALDAGRIQSKTGIKPVRC